MKNVITLVAIMLLVSLAFAHAVDGQDLPRPALQIINGSTQAVDVFWLKSDTERVSNGFVLPGKDTVITTTLGHRFEVVGRNDKKAFTVTSEVPVQAFRYDPQGRDGIPSFYTQVVRANGYPIVASAKVNPYALKEAAFVVNMMLEKRPEVCKAMIKSGSRLCILAYNEFTTDLPDFARLAEEKVPGFDNLSAKDYWDARARGLGGSETDPYCSIGEENVLRFPGDPYDKENILIHEFAHNIHLRGMVNVDPTFDKRVRAAYDSATKAGLWKGKYAAVNHHEYFAVGVSAWYGHNRFNDFDHNHVHLRSQLIEYDPALAALCREVFGDTIPQYTKPTTRLTGHMAGYDPAKAPKFEWPERLKKAKAECRAKAVAREKAANASPGAGVEDRSLLTVDRIFGKEEFETDDWGPALWLKDGSGFTTLEKSEAASVVKDSEDKKEAKDVVLYDPESGKRSVLVYASNLVARGESKLLTVEDYAWSDDAGKLLIFTNTKRVWRRETCGDYWVFDRSTGQLKKLGGKASPSTMMFATFSPDGRNVAYVCRNNLYVQSLDSLKITQLTTDGSDSIVNGTSDWVYEEEFDLRKGFRWSPDGKSIAYWQFDTSGVREFKLVNNTDELYPKITSYPYPKVGETNSACRVGVIRATGGRTRWFQPGGDPRNHYIPQMKWAPDSRHVLLQQINRLQNTNLVFSCDAKNGNTEIILTDRDDAWVEMVDDFRWIEDGRRFLWLSERDGWMHVYAVTCTNRRITLLTPGAYDVIKIEGVDEKNGWLYFIASPDNPTQRYLYRASLDGRGEVERVTPKNQPGTHSYQMSKDCRWAIHSFSRFGQPPVTDLVSLSDCSVMRVLAGNSKLRGKLAELKACSSEFFRVGISNGVQLDAWCIKPPKFNPAGKYPLFILVYGEPADTTVVDSWGRNSYLWHYMLAQQGYIVMSIDNRGTQAPRGRDWRRSIYRQVGIVASSDQAEATRQIIRERPYVDPKRIGIWGSSGGGSMSLNAIFRYPDLYSTAMALSFVSNQRFYDTIYQERYMGLPADNPDGFKNGSPITFAHQLKGNLLLVYGTGDDNCHYQNCEALINELIKQNKQFSLMSYPNRSHAIKEGDNTRRHLFETLTRYLHENLPVQE